jgi:hypothetical protein
MSLKATEGLIALMPETDCDQTAIGLPPITSAAFLIAILVIAKQSGRNIRDASSTPSGIKRERYVCMNFDRLMKMLFLIEWHRAVIK